MKIQTLVTTTAGKDKNGKTVFVPPGVIDLPDDEAQRLIGLGMAKSIAQAASDAAASAGEVSITHTKGPKIISVREGNPVAGEPAEPVKTGKRNRRSEATPSGE